MAHKAHQRLTGGRLPPRPGECLPNLHRLTESNLGLPAPVLRLRAPTLPGNKRTPVLGRHGSIDPCDLLNQIAAA